jgi:hypothetical protein
VTSTTSSLSLTGRRSVASIRAGSSDFVTDLMSHTTEGTELDEAGVQEREDAPRASPDPRLQQKEFPAHHLSEVCVGLTRSASPAPVACLITQLHQPSSSRPSAAAAVQTDRRRETAIAEGASGST